MTNAEEYIQRGEERLFGFMGLKYPYNRPASKWAKDFDPHKIVCVSDVHEPYGAFPVFEEVERLHKDAEVLVSPGDVGDYYSKSRFKKNQFVDFKMEVRSVFLRLEWMATHFRKVYVMLGNHDDRPEKQIGGLFQAGSVDLLVLTESCLLKKLASYFDNITVVETPIAHSEIVLSHVWQYGDIVFTHAERSQAQKSALLGTLSLNVFRWSQVWGLKPYSIIAQGHNHQGAKVTEGKETWFLLPAAADPRGIGFGYIHTARMQGSPPTVGYNLFYQENGITDVNRSNYFVVKYDRP